MLLTAAEDGLGLISRARVPGGSGATAPKAGGRSASPDARLVRAISCLLAAALAVFAFGCIASRFAASSVLRSESLATREPHGNDIAAPKARRSLDTLLRRAPPCPPCLRWCPPAGRRGQPRRRRRIPRERLSRSHRPRCR